MSACTPDSEVNTPTDTVTNAEETTQIGTTEPPVLEVVANNDLL